MDQSWDFENMDFGDVCSNLAAAFSRSLAFAFRTFVDVIGPIIVKFFQRLLASAFASVWEVITENPVLGCKIFCAFVFCVFLYRVLSGKYNFFGPLFRAVYSCTFGTLLWLVCRICSFVHRTHRCLCPRSFKPATYGVRKFGKDIVAKGLLDDSWFVVTPDTITADLVVSYKYVTKTENKSGHQISVRVPAVGFNESVLFATIIDCIANMYSEAAFVGFIGYCDPATDVVQGCGAFLNLQGRLVTARHTFWQTKGDHACALAIYPERAVLYRTEHGPRIPVDFSKLKHYFITSDDCPQHSWVGTGKDIVGYEVEPGLMSKLGCKEFKVSDISHECTGSITVYGNSIGKPQKSTAGLCYDAPTALTKGLLSHCCSTEPGFSGSPMILKQRNGKLTVVGLHTLGDYQHEGKNHGVTSHCILALARAMGLHSPLFPSVPAETKSESRETVKQAEPEFEIDELLTQAIRDRAQRASRQRELHDRADEAHRHEERLMGDATEGDAIEAKAQRLIDERKERNQKPDLTGYLERTIRWADMEDSDDDDEKNYRRASEHYGRTNGRNDSLHLVHEIAEATESLALVPYGIVAADVCSLSLVQSVFLVDIVTSSCVSSIVYPVLDFFSRAVAFLNDFLVEFFWGLLVVAWVALYLAFISHRVSYRNFIFGFVLLTLLGFVGSLSVWAVEPERERASSSIDAAEEDPASDEVENSSVEEINVVAIPDPAIQQLLIDNELLRKQLKDLVSAQAVAFPPKPSRINRSSATVLRDDIPVSAPAVTVVPPVAVALPVVFAEAKEVAIVVPPGLTTVVEVPIVAAPVWVTIPAMTAIVQDKKPRRKKNTGTASAAVVPLVAVPSTPIERLLAASESRKAKAARDFIVRAACAGQPAPACQVTESLRACEEHNESLSISQLDTSVPPHKRPDHKPTADLARRHGNEIPYVYHGEDLDWLIGEYDRSFIVVPNKLRDFAATAFARCEAGDGYLFASPFLAGHEHPEHGVDHHFFTDEECIAQEDLAQQVLPEWLATYHHSVANGGDSFELRTRKRDRRLGHLITQLEQLKREAAVWRAATAGYDLRFRRYGFAHLWYDAQRVFPAHPPRVYDASHHSESPTFSKMLESGRPFQNRFEFSKTGRTKAYLDFLTPENARCPPRTWEQLCNGGDTGRVLTDAEAVEMYRAAVNDPSKFAAFRGVNPESFRASSACLELRAYKDAGGIEINDLSQESLLEGNKVILGSDGQPLFVCVGTGNIGSTPSAEKHTPMSPQALDVLKALGKDFTHPAHGSTYVMPPTGPSASLASLRAQAQEMKLKANMDRVGVDKHHVLEAAYDAYPQADFRLLGPIPGSDPEGSTPRSCTEALIDDIMNSFDGSKSSGWSATFVPGTKDAFLACPDGRAVMSSICMQTVCLRICYAPVLGKMRPIEMVLAGLKDPSILFTKPEAHSTSKVDRSAWRQIWACSLRDSIVQLMSHMRQNKSDINAYTLGYLHSQAIGIGHHDGGIQRFGQTLDVVGSYGPLNDRDAKGWDLSVARDAIMLDAERRCARAHVPADKPDARRLANLLLTIQGLCSSAHVACIGRQLWECQKFGLTDSGSPSTSGQNSPIRQIQVLICGALMAVSVGDDLLYVGEIDEEMLASFGVNTKVLASGCEAKPPAGPHEFTSHEWTRDVDGCWSARFLNLDKMLAHADLRTVANKEGTRMLSADARAGMLFALRHSPADTAIFRQFCEGMGWWVEGVVPVDVGFGFD